MNPTSTHPHIKEAAKRAIDDNFTFYTPVPGYMSLRKAIATISRPPTASTSLPNRSWCQTEPTGTLQRCASTRQSWRRSDHTHSGMVSYVGDGQNWPKHQRARARRNRTGFQDHSRTARSGNNPRTRLMILCSPPTPRQRVILIRNFRTRRCDQPSPADHCHRRRDSISTSISPQLHLAFGLPENRRPHSSDQRRIESLRQ